MSGQILTVASAMFMIPLILMLGIGVAGDIPGAGAILRRMVHGLQHDSRSHRRVRRNERGALTTLNESQGGICILAASGIGQGVSQEPFGR